MGKYQIREFLSRTGLGMFLVWGCAAVLFLVAVAFSPFWGKADMVVGVAATGVLAVASLWYVLVFLVTLAKRQWKKSAIMFVSGGVGACLLAVGFGFAIALNFGFALVNWEKGKENPRLVGVPGEDGKTAFSVEYINAHPFLAEYDKTIVFKSGKRIGVYMDTGGAGPFAVYRLPTGEYYLVDGLKHNFIRNNYRVNVTNETVEMMTADTFWIRIPDGTLAVVGGGGNSIEVNTADEKYKNVEGQLISVGDSLSRRKYLGLIHPRGEFEKSDDGKDPYVGISEPKSLSGVSRFGKTNLGFPVKLVHRNTGQVLYVLLPDLNRTLEVDEILSSAFCSVDSFMQDLEDARSLGVYIVTNMTNDIARDHLSTNGEWTVEAFRGTHEEQCIWDGFNLFHYHLRVRGTVPIGDKSGANP